MSSPSTRFRPIFVVSALLSTLLVAGLGGTSFQRQLEASLPLGFEVEQQGELFHVVSVTHDEVGVEPGDVVMVAGPDTPASIRALESRLRSAESITLLVQRGEEFESVAYLRPGLELDPVYLALVVIGLLYLLIGLYTGLKQRHPRSSLFFFWCATSAALYLLVPALPPADDADRWIFLVDQASRTLLPALTLHLFLVFPAPLFRARWTRRLVPAAYAPSALLLLWHGSQVFLDGRFAGGPASTAQVLLVDRIELVLLVGISLLAAVALFAHLQRRPEWQHRKQVQWILLGLLAGYVPFLLLYVVPWIAGLATPTWSTLIAVLPLAFVPLAFAYAIFKYRLLELTVVMRDIASYSTAGVVGVFGFRLAQVLIDAGVAEELTLARNALTFAAGLAIAGALVPTKTAVSNRLERLQHGGLWAHRRLLRGLGHDLLYERDLDRLCATLVEQLEEGLVSRVNLFLRQGLGGLAPVRRRDGSPPRVDLELLGPEFWDRDVQAISGAQLPDTEPTDELRLFALGYRYAFPIRIQDQPVGLLTMSYKYDEDPLDGEDLELVRGLLNQAALAIENARLLSEVRHQLSEVERLEAWNEGILESSPSGIAVLGANRCIVSANGAFAKITGRSAEELSGQPIDEVLPVRPLPEPEDGLVEVGYCDPTGDEHYLQLEVAVYSGSESRPGQRVLVARDVSEKVNMELRLKEKEHLASLGMLAAGVAHEVNTPLTGISSYAQFLMADLADDDPRQAILRKMEKQTFRASQIVNSLLDFSRNRRGEMGRVDLAEVLADTVQLLEMRASRDGVSLTFVPPAKGASAHVLGNEGELHQVFTNLVSNAVDAVTAAGDSSRGATGPERRVSVDLECLEHRVRARVTDTGPGVPPERLATIFKPFFSSKLGQGGTGLGLAISFNIVRRHGGEIRAENHPESEPGCTFTVELPSYQTITH
ncbi:MAG: ATP-binding protein [Holophagales bacterium]|nr:ATP-binding protein [Holophagales bacterium]